MVARFLDGKAIASAHRARVKIAAEAFAAQVGRPPGLAVVLVGEDPASVVYTRNKERAAQRAGIAGSLHRLSASISEADLLARVVELNADDNVDALLVQLPLPAGIDSERVVDAVHPDKDVDGFHPVNAGRLATGRAGLVPCTPMGCMHLLALALDQPVGRLSLAGKRALVIGRSNIVGKPMAHLLLAAHATVTIAHSRTTDLASLCREADVLVAAVGRPRMVKGDWVKPGAVVLDVGTNRTDDGALCGDVDTEAAAERAAAITPVPGGVGPMTIAYLLDNTVRAARHRLGLDR